jgi:ABC-2 type transport system permease protein
MKELAIAATNLRRTLRERTSVFFVFLFPMMMILILGVAFGGSYTPRVGVVAAQTDLATGLSDRLRAAPGFEVRPYPAQQRLIEAVERGEVDAGVILPDEPTAPVRLVLRPGLHGQQVSSMIATTVNREALRLRAVRFVQDETGAPEPAAAAAVADTAAILNPTTITMTSTGAASGSGGRFDAMAAGQLLLFVFLLAMTSSVGLVESRRLGVSRRMLATPTSTATIIRGEALARFSVCAVQAVVIMAGSALLFDVGWGDPFAAAALVTAFALVASATGLLVGALARTGEYAVGIGLLLGLGLAALGGSMTPMEFFTPAMRQIAHLTPHAWASDALSTLALDGGGLADIAGPMAVLSIGAAVLFTVAAWVMRRRLAR